MNLVNELQLQLDSKSLESFASLRRGGQLSQFDLNKFTGAAGQSLRTNQFFINRHVGR